MLPSAYYGCLVLAVLVVGCSAAKLEVNEAKILESYYVDGTSNVYIVDLRKVPALRSSLVFKCSGGPGTVELNLTFTGLNPRTEKVFYGILSLKGTT